MSQLEENTTVVTDPLLVDPLMDTPLWLDWQGEGDLLLPPVEIESDEPPLESDLHRDQIDQLLRILKDHWRDRNDFYATGNLTIYYNQKQLTNRDFRGPDFFVVLGTEQRDRTSWVIWHENGQYPNVIIEMLSNSTAAVDRGLKKELYQNTFRTPEYFWFHPHTRELQGFHLLDGQYQPLQPNTQGRLWSQQLELWLGLESGKLRFFTITGDLVPTPEERVNSAYHQAEQRAEQERQRAEQERQRAEQERQRAEQERQRAEQAEAELEQLRSRLRDQQSS